MSCKVYVDVKVIFDKYGNLTPLSLVWQDGAKYDIDRILDIRPAASLKAGGMGYAKQVVMESFVLKTPILFDSKVFNLAYISSNL